MIDNLSLDKILKVLALFFLLVSGLYFARDFFIPFVIAALISCLMLPVTKKLESWGLGRVFPIVLCLLVVLFFISLLFFMFTSHMMDFADNYPALEKTAQKKLNIVLEYIESIIKVDAKKQKEWIVEMNKHASVSDWVQRILFTTTNLLLTMLIIAVYVFCFLFYRNKIYTFFLSVFSKEKNNTSKHLVLKIQKVASRYFSGVLIVMVILGTMHAIGLYCLGIKHAVFLGYLAGMFILVPVVGTMVGSCIPFMIALLTKDSIWYAVGVASVFSFNLFIESQVLTPLIVGSRIRINPMVVILAIVIGGLVWGIAGMVLFIPLLGMLKIVSDHVENLHPLKLLLSDDHSKNTFNFWGIFKSKEKNTENPKATPENHD